MIKINKEVFKPEYFPDGTMKLNMNNTDNIVDISWFYDSEEELVQLYYIVSHIFDNYPETYVSLFMPYVPNARFDRVKNEKEIFTLKYFSEFINNLGFNEVTVFDPHSHVSEALIDRLCIQNPLISIAESINKITKRSEELLLFFPDEGSTKRYEDVIKTYSESPYTFGIKNRDWVTGEIKGLSVNGQVDQIKGRDVLIIDDICSKGGTFYYSAKKLKELGANKIYLYVSHCENTIYAGELLKDNGLIEKIFTTDSILTDLTSPKIELVEEWRK